MPVLTSRNLWEDVLIIGNIESGLMALIEASLSPPSERVISTFDEAHITNIGESDILWTDSPVRSLAATLEGHILFPNGTIILKGRNNVSSLKLISSSSSKIVCSIRAY